MRGAAGKSTVGGLRRSLIAVWGGAAIGVGVLVGAVMVAETGFSPMAQTWVLARNPALWIWRPYRETRMRSSHFCLWCLLMKLLTGMTATETVVLTRRRGLGKRDPCRCGK